MPASCAPVTAHAASTAVKAALGPPARALRVVWLVRASRGFAHEIAARRPAATAVACQAFAAPPGTEYAAQTASAVTVRALTGRAKSSSSKLSEPRVTTMPKRTSWQCLLTIAPVILLASACGTTSGSPSGSAGGGGVAGSENAGGGSTASAGASAGAAGAVQAGSGGADTGSNNAPYSSRIALGTQFGAS